jgi:hypothetical protein
VRVFGNNDRENVGSRRFHLSYCIPRPRILVGLQIQICLQDDTVVRLPRCLPLWLQQEPCYRSWLGAAILLCERALCVERPHLKCPWSPPLLQARLAPIELATIHHICLRLSHDLLHHELSGIDNIAAGYNPYKDPRHPSEARAPALFA